MEEGQRFNKAHKVAAVKAVREMYNISRSIKDESIAKVIWSVRYYKNRKPPNSTTSTLKKQKVADKVCAFISCTDLHDSQTFTGRRRQRR